jgi:hypothetical protein
MLVAHDAGMMTQQIGFSILTAPLAAIDRRSLSQAWYSALHLAQHGASQPASAHASVQSREHEFRQIPGRTSGEHVARASTVRFVPHPRAATHADAPHEERRAARSLLARRIERAFLDPSRRVERATFTLDGSRARVHVALQSTGTSTRLVAVCPSSMRAGVARALEEARYALALRGVALHIDLKEA